MPEIGETEFFDTLEEEIECEPHSLIPVITYTGRTKINVKVPVKPTDVSLMTLEMRVLINEVPETEWWTIIRGNTNNETIEVLGLDASKQYEFKCRSICLCP